MQFTLLIIIVCGRVPLLYQYWPSGFMLLWFYVQELPKAQPAVVLVTYNYVVCGRVPWLYQYWPGGFMFTVVLCPGTPKGSTGSGSGFKASQKTGQRLSLIRQTE